MTEEAALTLPPKFTVYEKVNKQQCLIEIETMVSKYLWTIRKEGEDEKDNELETNESRSDEVSYEDVASLNVTVTENDSTQSHLHATQNPNDTQTQTSNDRPRNSQNMTSASCNTQVNSVAMRTRSQTRKMSAQQEVHYNASQTAPPSQPL